MTPRLILNLPNFASVDPGSWDHLLVRARAADAAGVDSLWVADHVALGGNVAAYSSTKLGGTAGETLATGEDGVFLDPLIVLAAVAAVTTRVRLMTTVLLAALRRPALLAKACATLDVLSHGRVDLGVGVGWQREEYDVCGVDFDRRGELLDAVLEVCQRLWREDPATVRSPSLGIEAHEIHARPRPVQAGGVPIYVGGNVHKRSLARLLQFGTGWIVWGDSRYNPGPAVSQIRQTWREAGRDPEELRIVGNLYPVTDTNGVCDVEQTMRALPLLLQSGVTDFRFVLDLPADETDATIALRNVVDAFRRKMA